MLALHLRPGVDALAAEFVAGDVQPGAQQPRQQGQGRENARESDAAVAALVLFQKVQFFLIVFRYGKGNAAP